MGLAAIIDDEEIDQRQFRRILTRSGLFEDVIVFSYADEALAYLADNPDVTIDVIFLDINMPRMTGLEFLAAATERLGPTFAKVVVAMLTTSLNPKDREEAHRYDVVKGFISKPLTLEDVGDVARMAAMV